MNRLFGKSTIKCRPNLKKKCYLSSSSNNFEAVQLLAAELNSNDYSFHSGYMLQEQQIKQNIDDSTLFIAFVTKDYLSCNKSMFEFHYAIENKKDLLCYYLKHLIVLKNYAMCQPWNLIVDKNSNIYTTVAQIDEKKFISKDRYLCKLNKHGDMLDCCQLEQTYLSLSNDMIFLDDKLIFLKENEIIIYSK